MYTLDNIPAVLEKMANTLKTEMTATPATDNANTEMPLMIGIHTGGVWIAEHLHELLALQEPLGRLNIAFYRDDFSEIGLHPRVEASDLPTMDITGRHIILVDDVLYTGRTIRAALNEIFDYGRPAKVTLAVLVERNGRQLPIQADVVGMHIELSSEEYLQLDGPDSFVLSVSKKSS